MTGDTITFRKGSTFEFQGQFRDDEGVPQPLTGVALSLYETSGSGMQDATISIVDAVTGKFIVQLTALEAKKLPLGRNSWFKIQFQYPEPTLSSVVFPPIWVDAK